VQLLVTYYVALPMLGLNLSALTVCVLVFGLNSGAYVSEIMRGGIMSVDHGQMEAGRAVGLSYRVTMIKIVVPQAVVSFVGAADLYVAFNYIGTNSYEFMVPYLVMAFIYIVLVMIIALFIKVMERRLRKSDRRN
jgi:ABC-type amino acid transport system permease subunit